MKRCPKCHRTETDEGLKFCRVDGAALISESGAGSAEAGTLKLGSTPMSSEIKTSILPQTIDLGFSRSTGPTTVLSQQMTSNTTGQLTKGRLVRNYGFICALSFALLSRSGKDNHGLP